MELRIGQPNNDSRGGDSKTAACRSAKPHLFLFADAWFLFCPIFSSTVLQAGFYESAHWTVPQMYTFSTWLNGPHNFQELVSATFLLPGIPKRV